MDIQEIYALINHFEGSALSRMKLEIGEVKLLLEKIPDVYCQRTEADSPTAHFIGRKAEEAKQDKGAGKEVKAPFVGTFYRSPSPQEKPFVTAGQSVKKGEVVGIIEAMKLMNEIVAPQDGVIDEVLAEDGAMVEYNQTLMTFK